MYIYAHIHVCSWVGTFLSQLFIHSFIFMKEKKKNLSNPKVLSHEDRNLKKNSQIEISLQCCKYNNGSKDKWTIIAVQSPSRWAWGWYGLTCLRAENWVGGEQGGYAEKAVAPHSRTLAWRIPGMVEPDGLPSMGSHRVGHDWSDLAAAAAAGRVWGGGSKCTNEKSRFLKVVLIQVSLEYDAILSQWTGRAHFCLCNKKLLSLFFPILQFILLSITYIFKNV